jgi:sugar lactone lactonase YvrE
MEFTFGPAPMECRSYVGWPEELPVVEDPLDGTDSSIWGTIIVATDGKVYIPLSNHGMRRANVALYCYTPATDQMRKVFDFIEHFGPPEGPNEAGHGKIHCRVVEGPDGKIYWGTTVSGSTPEGMGYRGGHLLRYDPKTDTTEDLGIPVPGIGIHSIWIDWPRQFIWGLVISGEKRPPRCFFGYNLQERRLEMLLPLLPQIHDVFMDARGLVYTQLRPGYLLRYDPDKKELKELLSIRLPDGPPSPYNQFQGPMPATISCPSACLGKDGRIYDSTEGGMLFIFDPSNGEEGEIDVLGPSFGDGSHDVHQENLALNPDEKSLWYTVNHGELYDPRIGKEAQLCCYDLVNRKAIHIGGVQTHQYQHFFDTFGIAVAPDGTVYVGAHRPAKLAIYRPPA